MLKRSIEIWMRSKNGEDNVTNPHFPVKRNSMILWYNGTNTEWDDGNHYDALVITNKRGFSKRGDQKYSEYLKASDPVVGERPFELDATVITEAKTRPTENTAAVKMIPGESIVITWQI